VRYPTKNTRSGTDLVGWKSGKGLSHAKTLALMDEAAGLDVAVLAGAKFAGMAGKGRADGGVRSVLAAVDRVA
jgi:hypothetical protein